MSYVKTRIGESTKGVSVVPVCSISMVLGVSWARQEPIEGFHSIKDLGTDDSTFPILWSCVL